MDRRDQRWNSSQGHRVICWGTRPELSTRLGPGEKPENQGQDGKPLGLGTLTWTSCQRARGQRTRQTDPGNASQRSAL